ncbi:hypothetical protein SAMN05421863_10708 [Nitrosomonas communis]|uniref:Uncharacterized protein n=1 Tax=Nitrosomonas communis TaxID=44574 RepID=A0A1I4UTB0_9PROT|nr:hypothetical protein SAMN05421863_10708 [Nitrosomonas communis]
MLQAIITHRYDVLARYAKYLKQTAIAEISNLHARNPTGLQEATALEAVKHWLQRDAGELPEKERAALQQARHYIEVLKDHLLDAAGTDRSVEPLYCIQGTACKAIGKLVSARRGERHQSIARILPEIALL